MPKQKNSRCSLRHWGQMSSHTAADTSSAAKGLGDEEAPPEGGTPDAPSAAPRACSCLTMDCAITGAAARVLATMYPARGEGPVAANSLREEGGREGWAPLLLLQQS